MRYRSRTIKFKPMIKKSTSVLQKNITTAKNLEPKKEVIEFLLKFSKTYNPSKDLN